MAITEFTDYPLADRDREWDSSEAVKRLQEYTGFPDNGISEFASCFLWYDDEKPELKGSYKLPYCDIIDGEIYAIPRAIFAATGGRGVDAANIPPSDKEDVKKVIAMWYSKMSKEFGDDTLEVPWEKVLLNGASTGQLHMIKAQGLIVGWMAISSNTLWDLEDERIDVDAMDDAIKYAWDNSNFGELRIEHVPNSRIGTCTGMVRLGTFLVEWGHFDGDKIEVAKRLATSDTEYKISVGFLYHPDNLVEGVYTKSIRIFERSITRIPANYFTGIGVLEGGKTMSKTIMVNDDMKASLAELLGDDKADELLSQGLSEISGKSGMAYTFKMADDEDDNTTADTPDTEEVEEPANLGDAIKACLELTDGMEEETKNKMVNSLTALTVKLLEVLATKEDAEVHTLDTTEEVTEKASTMKPEEVYDALSGSFKAEFDKVCELIADVVDKVNSLVESTEETSEKRLADLLELLPKSNKTVYRKSEAKTKSETDDDEDVGAVSPLGGDPMYEMLNSKYHR